MTKLQGLINHNLSYSNCHAVGICPIFRHIHVKTLWGRAQGCVQVLADWGVPLLKCYLPASHQIWRASLQPGTPFFWQLSTDGTGSIHWNLVSIAPLKSGNASFHRFTRSTSTRPSQRLRPRSAWSGGMSLVGIHDDQGFSNDTARVRGRRTRSEDDTYLPQIWNQRGSDSSILLDCGGF